MWSPYVSNYNNPISHSDPKGDFPILIPLIAYAIAAGEAAVTTGLVVTTVVVGANAAEKHHNANAGTNTRSSYMSGSPLGLTTGDAYRELNKPAVVVNNVSETTTTASLSQLKSALSTTADALLSFVDAVRNPFGARGKPDHQDKVKEPTKKAKSEAKEGEQVLTERKVQGHDSNRKPDAQIVDKDGKTRKIFEAERKPESKRNKNREKEYDNLNIEHETHKVGN